MKELRTRRIIVAAGVFMLLMVAVLIGATLRFDTKQDSGQVSSITEAEITVEGKTANSVLPVVLQDLPGGTEVSVSFSVSAAPGNALFFGSVYAPLSIFAGEKCIYEYGEAGTFPRFMSDPPTTYDSVALPFGAGKEIPVTMVYRSPQERSSLSIHEPMIGDSRDLLRMLLLKYGIQMILAVLILFVGLVLAAMSIFFLEFPSQGQVLLFLGLLCFASGSWQFGENTLAVYLLESPALLYVLDFCGLFTLVIPLYKLAMLFLDQPDNRILQGGMFVLEIAASCAVLLQLFGITGMHRSLYAFHLLLPLAVLSIVGVSFYYCVRYERWEAGLFTVPFLILLVAALLEVINYYFRLMPKYSFIFQLGLLLFLVAMAVFSGLYARKTLKMRFWAMELQNEVTLREQAIEAQKVRNELLLSHFEEVRKQRHDLRHHLRTVSDLLEGGETAKASEYIRSLSESIPAYNPEVYCDNVVVNSTLCYYIQAAREDGVDIKVRVQVPATNRDISDANLCVIFGNLLENATEACRRVEGNRFIALSSRVSGEMLFITMDNSTPGGAVRGDGGLFASDKGAGRGLGLRSIRSIAERNAGSAEFREEKGVFQSEVCVKL